MHDYQITYSPNRIEPPTVEFSAADVSCVLIDLDAHLERQVRRLIADDGSIRIRDVAREAFISGLDASQAGCVITAVHDINSPTSELFRVLNDRASALKVVCLATCTNVRSAVSALKNGALDVLAWPDEEARLAPAIIAAYAASVAAQSNSELCRQARRRLAQLTERELEVVELMLIGASNKKIAAKLDIALRTVELRRSGIFTKLNTRNIADIFRMIHLANRSFVEHSPSVRVVARPHFSGSTALPNERLSTPLAERSN